jgi:uncharacterized surface protein with fasciclin (FAS1) repeats
MKIKNVFFAALLLGLTSLQACKSKTATEESVKEVLTAQVEEESTKPMTIVDVAIANENFSTLVTAVKAADLVGVLSSDGPFTVFAPTNDAFAQLPEGTLPNLIDPANQGTLSSILTYHVISGKFDAATVIDAIKSNDGEFEIVTVQGGSLTASLLDGNVILTDLAGNISTVVIADVAASNGIIHAIDTVLMPE